jgi:mRNA interferase MazF
LTTPDERGDFISLPVTSVPIAVRAIGMDADDMRVGRLPKPSWIRFDKVFTLNEAGVGKIYGTLRTHTFSEAVRDFCDYVGCPG